ncbi:hypothetical protein GCM10010123_43260 [Pilimelia anulata]|uniref:GtrA/DPMS transmembrane domain-containing protein n=1 Tax=Pilimelia anulata TaxID=53371 RepID=A0A8J3BEG1_9ACTN|nr:GtrA family protein [Pilimelia anulata]GGK08746.1 hypothetical protein GCM10010123_43260 [Pilimelia anulata]
MFPAAVASTPGVPITAATLARLAADQRVRYLLAGGLSAAVYYLLFTAGWLAAGRWLPYPALAVATCTATALVTYPLYRRGVFRADGPIVAGFLRFYAVCLWALLFGVAGLALLVEVLGVHVLVAQAAVLVAGPAINYRLGRGWAFRRREVRGAR